MSKKRKRISRRRLAGQRVLAHVPTFNLETGAHKPVTAARRYIAETELMAPAILNVRRNEHTTDRFFWGEKGLFSAQYAEENHFLFPSLRLIVDSIGEEVLFEGLEGRGPLAELRACFRFVRRNARATDGRDQNRRQDTNDRDYGEEFDQGEARRGAERLRTAAKEAHGSLSA
jgi:hypothetical protein